MYLNIIFGTICAFQSEFMEFPLKRKVQVRINQLLEIALLTVNFGIFT